MTRRGIPAHVAPTLPAVIALIVAACSPPSPAQPTAPAAQSTSIASDKLQSIIDGARKERQLTLVWGENTVGGSEAARRWTQGLNKLYGLDLNVQFTPGPSMPDMATKITQEFQAKRAASSDVFIGSEAHISSMMQYQALEPVDWMGWAPNIQNPELLATRDGIAVEIASRTPGITYNTRKFSGDAVPTSMQDLLNPRYKGHVASTPYAAMFDRLASPDLWGEQRTVDYVTKLADQASGLMRCGEIERIVSGEFDIFALDCGTQDARKAQSNGAPVAQVIPSDVAAIVYFYVGVPKNAAHPNAAKLFINYLLSREAQDIMFETDQSDHYLIPGSRSAGDIAKLKSAGVSFSNIDVAFVLRNDEKELARIRAQLQNILQKKA